MFANAKTNYRFSSTHTTEADNKKVRAALEAFRDASRVSRMPDPFNIRISTPSEADIAKAVTRYFLKPEFSKFRVREKYEIEIDSAEYSADVVLCDEHEKPTAIVECQLLVDPNYSHEPLKSFLRATGAPFGIFAPSIGENSWHFYQNSDDRIRLIEQPDFEARLLEGLEAPANELAVM